ncbi:MAG: peptide methionine sulfoxide reductase MsrA [Nitrospirales bacterium]|nr:MAG: peptide methionine sulfoxide reductase MsrA [Nitrospirales bacterium]
MLYTEESNRIQGKGKHMNEKNANMSSKKEITTLGGGCFWCLEAAYDQLKGVESVESGYMGGQVQNPTYDAVCMGNTGHVEVVQVTFDPSIISYREILEIFFAIHDPTTLNRQGNDSGTQYRSAIFYHSPEQKDMAEEVIARFTKEEIFDQPIVTEVVPAVTFYIAEEYHQEYFVRNPSQPYCAYLINPKVAKFRQQFAEKLKTS